VHLADVTGYDERTIRNVLGGRPVRDQTVTDICEALEIEPILEAVGQPAAVADPKYGEYPRGPYRKYEGGYFAYRRSFSSDAGLMRTVVVFEWADEEGLIFSEHSQFQTGRRQIDNSQKGHVYISQMTGLLHLVTSVEGAVRLITLTTELDHTDRKVIEIVTRKHEPPALAEWGGGVLRIDAAVITGRADPLAR